MKPKTAVVLATFLLLAVSLPSSASAACLTAQKWQTGNNSDPNEQNIGDPTQRDSILLEFHGPVADQGLPAGYTTFTAPIRGLKQGAKYRLSLRFKRETNGLEREVSLSVSGLRPQGRIIFRRAGLQTFQKIYTADRGDAVIMIHMKGFMKMWSFAGLPRLCQV